MDNAGLHKRFQPDAKPYSCGDMEATVGLEPILEGSQCRRLKTPGNIKRPSYGRPMQGVAPSGHACYQSTQRHIITLSDGAAPAHPAYLDRFPGLDDYGNGSAAVGQLKHAFVCLCIPLNIVFDKLDAPPLQILAGRGAMRAACRRIEFHR